MEGTYDYELLFIKRKLIENAQLAKESKYYVQKQLGVDIEYDESIEKKISMQKEDYSSPLNKGAFSFKENFFNSIGKNLFENKLEDYKDEAIKYLEESYPYCFNTNLREDLVTINNWNYTYDLAYFSLCLGATNEQMVKIKDVLKSERFKQVTIDKIGGADNNEKNHKKVNIDNIVGTTVEKYNADNLFDTLLKINDKNISRYIEYIMKNGGLNTNSKAFEGICVVQDQNDNMFVTEGNHRVFVYKALKRIKEFITDEDIDGLEIEATYTKGITKEKIQKNDEERN